MELYLIRHAEAEPAAGDDHDAERPLTRKGRKRFKAAVKGFKRLGVRFDHLYHSPLLRAVQTAELITGRVDGVTVVSSGLNHAPDAALLAEITGDRVAVVGHEPWMSQLLAWLVLDDPSRSEKFHLNSGGVAWLTGDLVPGGMILGGLYDPTLFRKLL